MLCYHQDSLGTAAWLCFELLCNLEMATKIGKKLSFFGCFENTNTSGGREAWAAAAAATTTKTKLPELFNQPRGWHLWEQISKTWEAVPAQWMSADSRASQADTLQPICKTPLRLKKAQTLRRRQVLSDGFSPSWPGAGKGKHPQKDPGDTPARPAACGLAAVQEMEIAFIAPRWRALPVSLSHSHSGFQTSAKWGSKVRYKVKILLFYSPSSAKGTKKGIINVCQQMRTLLCSTPVLWCQGEDDLSHSYNLHGHDTDFWHSLFFHSTESYNPESVDPLSFPIFSWKEP